MTRRLIDDARRGDLDALVEWLRLALREGDREAAGEVFERLLSRWRETPWPALAEAVLGLGETLESESARALREASGAQVSQHQWTATEALGLAADRGALLATLHRGKLADIKARMQRVRAWPRDPRTASTFAGWLLELPFRATSSKPVWTVALNQLVDCADPRTAGRLQPTQASDWVWPAGDTMRAWLAQKVPTVLEQLARVDAPPAPSSGEQAALDRVAALARGGLGGALHLPVDTPPDADDPLEVALAAVPCEGAWRALVDEIELRDGRGELDDALLAHIDETLRDWPDEVRVAPVAWWRTLARSRKPEAHPALRIARTLELEGLPHNLRGGLAQALRHPATAGIRILDLTGGNLDEHAWRALTAHPASRIDVGQMHGPALARIAACPEAFGRLDTLDVQHAELDLTGLVESGRLTHLRALSLSSVGPRLLGALMQGEWPRLERLQLVSASPGRRAQHAELAFLRELRAPALHSLTLAHFYDRLDEVLEAVVAWPALPALRELEIGDESSPQLVALIQQVAPTLESFALGGALDQALARAIGACQNLRRLELYEAGAASLKPLFAHGELTGLRSLLLGAPTDAVLARLAEAPWATHLTSLALHDPRVSAAGMRSLADAGFSLERLVVWGGYLRNESPVAQIAESRHAHTLRSLSLERCGLDKAACQVLAAGNWQALRQLDLSNNPISPAAARVLAGSPTLRARLRREGPWPPDGLWTLRVAECPLGVRGRAILADAFGAGVATA